MPHNGRIYILGAGAVGLPLAAHLSRAGRDVVVVRTSNGEAPGETRLVALRDATPPNSARISTIGLSRLNELDGLMVITAKSHANRYLAGQLKQKILRGPIVILQNGIGVEQPFLDAGLVPLYRCVVYVTSEPASEHEFLFRLVASSPIGVVRGSESGLDRCVQDLNTDGFPFHAEVNIEREVWRKVIVNCVFNSICPLLETDNGVFVRDQTIATLARDLVRECLTVTDKLDLGLAEDEMMDQIMRISSRSSGQLISTLQDIRLGRPTEMEFLNLGVARIAASLQPAVHLPRTEFLGRIVLARSNLSRKESVSA